MSQKKMNILEGSLWDSLILFALPIALSSLLQQVFNMVDQAVVGRFAGSTALAAVGANTPVVALFVTVFTSCSIGANALIARKIGEGDRSAINTIVHTSISFAFLCGLAFCVLTQLFVVPLLKAIGTPEEVLPLAVIYLRIYIAGFPFALVFNFAAAILRSSGDTKRPMFALIAAGLINVVLNLLLVIGFDLNVAGVAIATTISNLVSAVIVICILCKETGDLKLRVKDLRIDGKNLLKILQIGAPASLQSAVFNIANICIQSGINSLGAAAIAGCSIINNFEAVGFFIANSFVQAIITFCGQNYGAGNLDRCKKVIRIALIESLLAGAVFNLLVVVFRYQLIGIFTTDQDVIDAAIIKIFLLMSLQFTIALFETPGAALRSMGRSLTPALLTILGCVGFRLLWLVTVFRFYGTLPSLMAVYPVSWFVTALLSWGYYFLVRKKVFGLRNAIM